MWPFGRGGGLVVPAQQYHHLGFISNYNLKGANYLWDPEAGEPAVSMSQNTPIYIHTNTYT